MSPGSSAMRWAPAIASSPGTSCRTTSCPGAARAASARRRRGSASCRAGPCATRRSRAPRPTADRLALVVEHADQRIGEVADFRWIDVDRGPRPRRPRERSTWLKSGLPPGRTLGSGTCSERRPLIYAFLLAATEMRAQRRHLSARRERLSCARRTHPSRLISPAGRSDKDGQSLQFDCDEAHGG